MDTIITRKSNKYKYITIAVIIILILSSIAYSTITRKSSLNIKRDEVIIKTIERKYFEDFIVFQAKVEPLNTTLVNIIEGGAVQKIFVENGDHVEMGQPLVQLYNPITELGYITQETSMIEQINNLNKAQLDLRNQELNMAKELALIDHDYIDIKNLYDLNKKLFNQDILSENEWIKTKENYRYQQERKKIIQESIKKEKHANKIQLYQMNKSIVTMNKSLEILRSNKKNFLVSAQVSGRLSSFEPIIGQSYQAGESIGKIDVMQGYKLIAKVDEFYLDRVAKNLTGIIEYKGNPIEVIISKVIPEINEGRFQVELNFKKNMALNLQQGLGFGVRLILSGKTKSTLLSKGSFHQETYGKWIFVVEGNKAVRRNIKLGRENPLYYEIDEGLVEGEKVITSGYEDYINSEVLILQ